MIRVAAAAAGLIFFVMLCLACANRLNPTGGPRDEEPPQIIAESSTQNFQTNFESKEIALTMNEWVELDDPINQVLVSPPLDQRPDIRLKGKTVVFNFHEDEVLREGATYTINFGEAIKDLTEGNPLANFSFVFSTGDFIDSLIVTGHIADAFSGEPVEDATIMMYDNLGDSAVYKEKPFYASRSGKDGTWQIQNVKEDTFRVIAVMDDNLNYRYDPGESIAFLDSLLLVMADTTFDLHFSMSTPLEEIFRDRLDTSGWNKAVLTYNRQPHEIEITTASSIDSIYWERRDLLLEFWYVPNKAQRHILYLTNPVLQEIDTIALITDDMSEADALAKQSKLTNSGHPDDPYFLCFNRPLSLLDSNKIDLRTTSGTEEIMAIYEIDSIRTCLQIRAKWQADSSYTVTFLPEALFDLAGLSNDTIRETFPIGGEDRFGNIELKASGFDSNVAYIIELIQGNKVERTIFVDAKSEFEISLTKLRPGTFSLRTIEDINRNRRWDPADFENLRQPERVVTQQIEPLRANWDVEVIFEWK